MRPFHPTPGTRCDAHVLYRDVPSTGTAWVRCRARADGFGRPTGLTIWVRADQIRSALQRKDGNVLLSSYQSAAKEVATAEADLAESQQKYPNGAHIYEHDMIEARKSETIVIAVVVDRWRRRARQHSPSLLDGQGVIRRGSVEAHAE